MPYCAVTANTEPYHGWSAVDIDAALQDMIGRVVTRYAELAGRSLAVDVATTYALLDGVFEKALLGHLTGDDHAPRDLRARVSGVLPRLLA